MSSANENRFKQARSAKYLKPVPDDVTFDVLSRLPVKSLSRFKVVNKTWYALIRNQFFVLAHLSRSVSRPGGTTLLISFDYESSHRRHLCFASHHGGVAEPRLTISLSQPVHASESVNGLICLCTEDPFSRYYKDAGLQILNLHTRELVFIKTESEAIHPNPNSYISYYFGYDPCRDEYKVLSVCVAFDRKNVMGPVKVECGIFSLKTGTWRRIPDPVVPFDFRGLVWRLYFKKCVCVNGVLHWLLSKENAVLAFDFRDEGFRMIPLPDELVPPPENAGYESVGEDEDVDELSGSENEEDNNFENHGGDHYNGGYENEASSDGVYDWEEDDISSYYFDLIQVGGCLALVDFLDVLDHHTIALWILVDYKNYTWIKRTITFPCRWRQLGCPIPVGTIHTGEILLKPDTILDDFMWVHYYDLKTRVLRSVKVTDIPDWRSFVINGRGSVSITDYVENIISLR